MYCFADDRQIRAAKRTGAGVVMRCKVLRSATAADDFLPTGVGAAMVEVARSRNPMAKKRVMFVTIIF